VQLIADDLHDTPLDAKMLKRLELLIDRIDIQGFMSPDNHDLREWYVSFVHQYAIQGTDVKKTQEEMADLHTPKNILDIVSDGTLAFVVLVVVNNYEVWHQKALDKTCKTRGGRWTKITKNPKNSSSNSDDTSGSEVSKNQDLRLKNESGWSSEGMEFYRNALKFFEMVRLDDEFGSLKNSAEDYYNTNHVIPNNEAAKKRMKRRQKEAERKKQKRVVERYDDAQWDSWVSMAAI
jgi:hypothetical protein